MLRPVVDREVCEVGWKGNDIIVVHRIVLVIIIIIIRITVILGHADLPLELKALFQQLVTPIDRIRFVRHHTVKKLTMKH